MPSCVKECFLPTWREILEQHLLPLHFCPASLSIWELDLYPHAQQKQMRHAVFLGSRLHVEVLHFDFTHNQLLLQSTPMTRVPRCDLFNCQWPHRTRNNTHLRTSDMTSGCGFLYQTSSPGMDSSIDGLCPPHHCHSSLLPDPQLPSTSVHVATGGGGPLGSHTQSWHGPFRDTPQQGLSPFLGSWNEWGSRFWLFVSG